MHLRIPFAVRAPDGTAAGAGAASDTAAGSSGADDPSLFDAVGDDAGAQAQPAQDGQQQDGKAAEGQQRPQRPDTIPEQFWDAEKGAARVEDMAKSWMDLRRQISRGEHKPPEKPEAYAVPKAEGVPEGLIGGEKDTLWPEIRQAAHAAGVTQKQLDALAAPFLRAVAEQMPAAADPEVRKAALQAELAKLGPNGSQVVRDVKGWINGLHGRGILADAERDALLRAGGAEAVRALAKLRELNGERPIPTEALSEDGMSQADAQRLMQEGYAANDQAKIDKARKVLQQMEQAGRLVVR